MAKGRILHLIDTGGPGGAETVCLELAVGLSERGWTSIPVVPEIDWLDGAFRAAGFEPTLVPANRALDWRYVHRLRTLIRSERIDLVQAHLLGSGVYASLACIGTDVPLVCALHGRPDISPNDRFRAFKTRLLRREATRVVCVSASLRDWFTESGDLGGNAVVIENGVALERFDAEGDAPLRVELGLTSTQPLVGAVGNVRKSKAYDVLLRAFAALPAGGPSPHLVIAGHYDAAWPAFRALTELSERLGIADRVHFLGFREDIPELMRSFDVFVLSSSDEGFSLVTVQAMASGRACVLTRSGGPEDIVGASEAALLVPPERPDALALAIDRLIRDPALRLTLGDRARRRARERYSTGRMVEQYEDLYRSLLS